MDQELPTAKRVQEWDAQQQKKLAQCSGTQGHICNYKIHSLLIVSMHALRNFCIYL